MSCETCGRVRHNQMLLRKYKPTEMYLGIFKDLRERNKQDTIAIANDHIAKGESVAFWKMIKEHYE